MELITTGDGSLSFFSAEYGVPYHSRYGALTESAHVFINAGLRFKAAVQKDLSILEIGLGTGLNAFLTQIEAERRNLCVRYTGIEGFPLSADVAAQLNYAERLGIPDRRTDFDFLHTCAWSQIYMRSEAFIFEKRQVLIEAFEAEAAFDLIYFDAFSPQAQPEMWAPVIFEAMHNALRPEGILVTYCAQGEVKRKLRSAGFAIESLQGPPGKREMTRATKN